jgi:hypothetical protein
LLSHISPTEVGAQVLRHQLRVKTRSMNGFRLRHQLRIKVRSEYKRAVVQECKRATE